jgi:hypothetical protein
MRKAAQTRDWLGGFLKRIAYSCAFMSQWLTDTQRNIICHQNKTILNDKLEPSVPNMLPLRICLVDEAAILSPAPDKPTTHFCSFDSRSLPNLDKIAIKFIWFL